MVLNDWMKLGVTDDEEEIFAHVPFAPGIEETKRNYFDAETQKKLLIL